MRLNIKIISVASTLVILLSACGGGSGDGGVIPPSNTKSYLVSPLDGAKKISLNYNQKIIAGYGCAAAEIYDSTGTKFENNETFPKGDYTVVFHELFGRYSDSKGILYYRSSGILLNSMPVNQSISVPDREAVLFQFILDSDKSFMISQSSVTYAIFDSTLKQVVSNSPFSPVYVSSGDSFDLKQGTYYIVGQPTYCTHSGSFTFTEL